MEGFILPGEFDDQSECDSLNDIFWAYHRKPEEVADKGAFLERLRVRNQKLMDYFISIGGERPQRVTGGKDEVYREYSTMLFMELLINEKLHPSEREPRVPFASHSEEIEIPDRLPDDM